MSAGASRGGGQNRVLKGMTLSLSHEQVDDATGQGKCSAPLWSASGEVFCDEPEFGRQEPGQRRYGTYGTGRFMAGHCPGLACYRHGGPEFRVFKDGEQWQAVCADFVSLQESPAGFGPTRAEAIASLRARAGGGVIDLGECADPAEPSGATSKGEKVSCSSPGPSVAG